MESIIWHIYIKDREDRNSKPKQN